MILALVLTFASPFVEGEHFSSCALAIAGHEGKNIFELGAGSKACEEEGRVDDAAYLELLTRIRLGADLTLLPPEDLHNLFRRPDFGEVFPNSGEFVEEALARDPERFAALIERVRNADLTIPVEYDPGWAIGDDGKRALYAEVIDGLRTDRLAMESYIASLVRDEVYFAAYLERVAMLTNPEDGAPPPERFDDVAEIMQARVSVLGDPPTETAVPWRKVYDPSPNAPFTVLYRGFNGPAQSEPLLFRSPSEVRQSWVVNALSQEELSGILSQIDFENEILGLYAVGDMLNATENIFVTEFGPQLGFGGYTIAVRVGVVGEHCGLELSRSYPFVLVKAPSQTGGELTSMNRANYPDQCAPVMVGEPTLVTDPG